MRPEAIAGEPVRWAYDAAARRFELSFVARADRSGPHRVYVPAAEDFAASFEVRCDGVRVESPRDARTGVVEVACGGVQGSHTLTVEGR